MFQYMFQAFVASNPKTVTLGETQPSMEPSVSKAWSSGSLEDSLKLAKTQHSAYKTAEIEEAAMQKELAAT